MNLKTRLQDFFDKEKMFLTEYQLEKLIDVIQTPENTVGFNFVVDLTEALKGIWCRDITDSTGKEMVSTRATIVGEKKW